MWVCCSTGRYIVADKSSVNAYFTLDAHNSLTYVQVMPRCDHCPAEAVVILPGTEPIYLFAPIRSVDCNLLVRGEPARAWCLACAKRAGWPWLASEKPRSLRAPRNAREPRTARAPSVTRETDEGRAPP